MYRDPWVERIKKLREEVTETETQKIEISNPNSSPDPSNVLLLSVINSILETTSFFIYDSKKMQEIIKGVETRLQQQFGLNLNITIRWLPPEIKTEEKRNLFSELDFY